ncbi:hypothetical protein KVV02_008529 [Mortierella alpina]|uniref:Uncharacterized protein n=1 Tax=Mortierella alpina TaxID=64518 RepID=A0A9P8CZ08_MORAP|nr:hypothetical protein KVV02_008529 [Mortierella alpina]
MIAPVQNQLSYVLITALDLIRQLRSTSWLLDPSVKLLKFTGRGPKRQIGIWSKSMLTHIGIGLTLGTAAAYGFWHKIVLSNRSQREQFYVKYNAVKA